MLRVSALLSHHQLCRVKPTTLARRGIHHKGTEAQPPDPPPIRETNIPAKIQMTQAPSIAVDKNYRKIYQRKPPPPNTNNSGHLTPYRQ